MATRCPAAEREAAREARAEEPSLGNGSTAVLTGGQAIAAVVAGAAAAAAATESETEEAAEAAAAGAAEAGDATAAAAIKTGTSAEQTQKNINHTYPN